MTAVAPQGPVADWSARAAQMLAEWRKIEAADRRRNLDRTARWARTAATMRQKQDALRIEGRWATGPVTLLGALRLGNSEVMLTRALGWLLDPTARHGLGRAPLDALAAHLMLPVVEDVESVRVRLEESRTVAAVVVDGGLTRADLVVYTADWTLLVEAKVYAPEQPDQLDRLVDLWSDAPDLCPVYLTRGKRAPLTARRHADRWRSLTWAEVGKMLRQAAASGEPGPGVLDYVRTLEVYHRA